jgi:hypothetical protein
MVYGVVFGIYGVDMFDEATIIAGPQTAEPMAGGHAAHYYFQSALAVSRGMSPSGPRTVSRSVSDR